MTIQDIEKQQIADVAEGSLNAFEAIAGFAQAELDSDHNINVETRNTFTERETAQTVSRHNHARLQTLRSLTAQPAIARVKARKDDGSIVTLFITRASPPRAKLENATIASYGAPIGAIAERHAGEEFEYSTRTGSVVLEIIEVAKLYPAHDAEGWESRNSVVEGETFKPVTVTSLRAFLADVAEPEELDVIEEWRTDYNTERPHTSLDGLTPQSLRAGPERTRTGTDSGYERGQTGGKVTLNKLFLGHFLGGWVQRLTLSR